MKRQILTLRRHDATQRGMSRIAPLSLMGLGPLGLAMGLSGCVTVKAPDKPIVINLNINIRQEVVYRLDNEAKDLIKNNEEGIF